MIYETGALLKCQDVEPGTPSKIDTLVIARRRLCLIEWKDGICGQFNCYLWSLSLNEGLVLFFHEVDKIK